MLYSKLILSILFFFVQLLCVAQNTDSTILQLKNSTSNTVRSGTSTISSILKKTDSLATTKNVALDSTVKKESLIISDSTNFKFNITNPIPKRAAMYSALLPGLGQTYNKQYYKIGIVYAGLGIATYLIATEYNKYQKYQEAYVYRTDNNPLTVDSFKQYNVSDLSNFKTLARSNLDKIVVYSAVWYGLNIIDALASAHLKTFDMSKSISCKVVPFVNQNFAGINFKIIINNQNNYAHSTNRLW
jgi:Family of unknown function (DUF5683)